MPARDSTQRFSSRVEHYVRARPTYPPQVIELLESECGLTPESVVADIASGTGIFSRLLLENGNHVFGVEPNAAMRRAGEEFLAAYPRFTSVLGAAEATTLPDRSVDFVTAAQAAHWFDPAKSRREFARILRPEGWLVALWNERRTGSTPFLRDYESLLLKYGTDYQDVRHEHTSARIDVFFAPSSFQERSFELLQPVDYSGLEGRLLSSSYTPPADHPSHAPMLHELRHIFDANQTNGEVVIEYTTRVYYGRLD
jgi:SAM-dependent methyltransferase